VVELKELSERIDAEYEVILGAVEICETTIASLSSFDEILNEVFTTLDIEYGDRYSFTYELDGNKVRIHICDKISGQEVYLHISAESLIKFKISSSALATSLEFFNIEEEKAWSVEIYPKGGITAIFNDYKRGEYLAVKNIRL